MVSANIGHHLRPRHNLDIQLQLKLTQRLKARLLVMYFESFAKEQTFSS